MPKFSCALFLFENLYQSNKKEPLSSIIQPTYIYQKSENVIKTNKTKIPSFHDWKLLRFVKYSDMVKAWKKKYAASFLNTRSFKHNNFTATLKAYYTDISNLVQYFFVGWLHTCSTLAYPWNFDDMVLMRINNSCKIIAAICQPWNILFIIETR